MATRGRKPLPTAIKVLEGDRGKGRRPINQNEPVPPKDAVRCPAWLLPEAKKEWKRLAPALRAMGVLTMADEKDFAGYCQAYARWREAEEFITQHGSIFQNAVRICPAGAQVPIAKQNLKSCSPCLRVWDCPRDALPYRDRRNDAESEDPMAKLLRGEWDDD